MPANLTASSHSTNCNFPARVFGILSIIIIICGNVLVRVSVCTEKALKTTTNYFIFSLAVADLLLAVLVLPLFVYAEFQDGVWSLSMTLCDGLMTMDVMLCTASIFNLCAISIDRFIAVSIPLNYNRKHVDQQQIVLLSDTWILASAVASPVMFGVNKVPNRDHSECKLEDNNYVVYSSICSFFMPCPIMLVLYCGMFHGLRNWDEARKATLRSSMKACRKLQEAASSLQPLSGLPLVIKKDLSDITLEELEQEPVCMLAYPGGSYHEHPNQNRQKKRAKTNGRERRAMRVLPVVVGAFLFCWTPFFVVHTMRALCEDCYIPSSVTSIVTWLGYVNSALNPVIYTIFNSEFRKFFRKFLPTLPNCCKLFANSL
ncbi:D(4) dopamine receptor-like [Carassius gibelio]|uniref:D(4) dopamine receptor-like n=1 Tax=Carassius gibelio TaxID=101364 RepID=UPI002277B3F9|nr:D(4) dopamine receptor-like [Carassius gibelio]